MSGKWSKRRFNGAGIPQDCEARCDEVDGGVGVVIFGVGALEGCGCDSKFILGRCRDGRFGRHLGRGSIIGSLKFISTILLVLFIVRVIFTAYGML